jgi:hypothetical protein
MLLGEIIFHRLDVGLKVVASGACPHLQPQHGNFVRLRAPTTGNVVEFCFDATNNAGGSMPCKARVVSD